MVQNNLTAKDVRERAEELSFPSSVVEFMQGQLGQVRERLSGITKRDENCLSSHMVDFPNHCARRC